MRKRNAGDIFLRDLSLFPIGEKLFQLGFDFRKRGVANDHQRGVVRVIPGLMEFDEVFAGHLRNAFCGAGTREWISVSMCGAVEQAGKHAQSHELGHGLLAFDGRENLLLLALEIAVGKKGVQNHVGKEVERRIQFFLERRQLHDGQIQIRIGVQLSAEQGQLIADL